jgi:hypothetical protein
VWTFRVAVHLHPGQASASRSQRQQTELAARVLRLPFGQALVGTVGAILVMGGVGFGYQAVSTDFQDRLQRARMHPAVWRAVTVIGAIGNWARAVVLVLVGVFIMWAAIGFQPQRARGLDGSLRTLAEQPYGPYLLCPCWSSTSTASWCRCRRPCSAAPASREPGGCA